MHPTDNDRLDGIMMDWKIWAKCFTKVVLNKIIVDGISAQETNVYDDSVIPCVHSSGILYLICCELP